MELEISLVHEDDEHESELVLAKECRNYFNQTKKKFLDKEGSHFASKNKSYGTIDADFPSNNNERRRILPTFLEFGVDIVYLHRVIWILDFIMFIRIVTGMLARK